MWGIEVLTTLSLWLVTRVPAQRYLCIYLLVSHLVKLSFIWGSPEAYAQVFYGLSVLEDVLLAVAALGTTCWAFPRYQQLLLWAGCRGPAGLPGDLALWPGPAL